MKKRKKVSSLSRRVTRHGVVADMEHHYECNTQETFLQDFQVNLKPSLHFVDMLPCYNGSS